MRLLFIPVIAIFFTAFTNLNPGKGAAKIINLKIDEIGLITDGRDTISTDDLAEYIRERLFKNYMGTGKMYDKIKVEKVNEGPLSTVMEVILKEIASGQKKALVEICLLKYKKSFELLNSKQQKKIRKQFPVLFQTDYT
jgi:hypothetical protein